MSVLTFVLITNTQSSVFYRSPRAMTDWKTKIFATQICLAAPKKPGPCSMCCTPARGTCHGSSTFFSTVAQDHSSKHSKLAAPSVLASVLNVAKVVSWRYQPAYGRYWRGFQFLTKSTLGPQPFQLFLVSFPLDSFTICCSVSMLLNYMSKLAKKYSYNFFTWKIVFTSYKNGSIEF